MQKTLKYIIFLIIFLVSFVTVAKADVIVCEYNIADLKITYDTDKKDYTVSYGKIDSDDVKINLLIARWGSSIDNVNLDIDQDVIKYIADNYGCPTGMHIGIYTENAADMPSIKEVFKSFAGLYDAITGDGWETWSNGYAIFNIQNKTIYVADDKMYREKYAEFVGGQLDGLNIRESISTGNKVKEAVSDFFGGGVLAKGAGFVAGLLTAGGTQIYAATRDAIVGDNDLISYRISRDIGIAVYDGPYVALNVECLNLKPNILKYQKVIGEYVECRDEACKKINRTILNTTEDYLKNQCSAIFDGKKYVDDGKDCINACLNMKETLANYKKGTDLENNYSYKDHCGFGQKLVAWIENIFRWIKYIVPVILIVLTILEFMGAMTGDKDDEMVKAKKHFIIRLVAIVLIFLLPPIIEFILTKMGFVYEGCGIF